MAVHAVVFEGRGDGGFRLGSEQSVNEPEGEIEAGGDPACGQEGSRIHDARRAGCHTERGKILHRTVVCRGGQSPEKARRFEKKDTGADGGEDGPAGVAFAEPCQELGVADGGADAAIAR